MTVDVLARPLRWVAAGLLFGLLLWAPIPFGSNRDWSQLLLTALACAAGSVALLSAACSGRLTVASRRAWPVHLGFALVAGTIGWQLTQGIGVPAEVQIAGLQTVGLWAAFVAVVLCVRDERGMRLIVGAVVASGLIQAVYGALTLLTQFDHILFVQKVQHLNSATGTYISRNNFAAHVALSLCVGIGVMAAHLNDPPRSWREFGRGLAGALVGGKGAFRLVLIVMVIGLVMSRSRMGNSAFFLALTVATLAGAVWASRVRAQLIVFTLSVVLLDVLVIGTYFGVDQVVERIRDTSLAGEQRDEVARDALSMFRAHPLWGVGAGSWQVAFEAYRGADLSSPQDHAHNDYLELIGEYGVMGAAGFVLMVLASGLAAVRAMRRRAGRMYVGLGIAGVMAICYWLVQASVDFNAQIPSLALLFVTVISLSWAGAYAKPPERRKSSA